MKIFTKKRIWLGIAVVFLAAIVFFGYTNREYVL